MAEQISRDPGVIFLSGILLLVAGLAITRAHSVWAGGWPVLVTVLGWLAILGGLMRMFFPMQLAALAAAMAQRPAGIITPPSSFWSWAAFSRLRRTAANKQAAPAPCYSVRTITILPRHMTALKPFMNLAQARYLSRRCLDQAHVARRRAREDFLQVARQNPLSLIAALLTLLLCLSEKIGEFLIALLLGVLRVLLVGFRPLQR